MAVLRTHQLRPEGYNRHDRIRPVRGLHPALLHVGFALDQLRPLLSGFGPHDATQLGGEKSSSGRMTSACSTAIAARSQISARRFPYSFARMAGAVAVDSIDRPADFIHPVDHDFARPAIIPVDLLRLGINLRNSRMNCPTPTISLRFVPGISQCEIRFPLRMAITFSQLPPAKSQ